MNKMIQRLTLANFKKIRHQTYEFTDFDLLVGQNNSGKSTVLQALAIWQYCIDEFSRRNRKGDTGIQIVLPNFTALPLPEFNLLWKNKETQKHGKILIEIELTWRSENGEPIEFGVELRYQTPQSVYAIPKLGWKKFHELREKDAFPTILYIPPFSGLEPTEIWYDDGVLRRNVGKAQPGSVLRNLLYRVVSQEQDGNLLPLKSNTGWIELNQTIKDWFGISLNPPQYEKGGSATDISVTYSDGGKDYDIISGGSGFHQVLTILAFFYGYPGLTAILLDEPDAHMHVNLQRKIIQFFQQKRTTQFLIATHAESFIQGVNANSIISVLAGKHDRVDSVPAVIAALSEVDNLTVTHTQSSPYILYVEGEDDARILRAWAAVLDKATVLDRFYFYPLGGGNKIEMKNRAEQHFKGLRQIAPKVQRIIVFDYDSDEASLLKGAENKVIVEWGRKNIDNYLLIPDAWKRAVLDKMNLDASTPDSIQLDLLIHDFFEAENLTLPKNANWRTVKANIFEVVDGKKILFETKEALFHRIRNKANLIVDRATVAGNMKPDELHNDIHRLFDRLESLVNTQ